MAGVTDATPVLPAAAAAAAAAPALAPASVAAAAASTIASARYACSISEPGLEPSALTGGAPGGGALPDCPVGADLLSH